MSGPPHAQGQVQTDRQWSLQLNVALLPAGNILGLATNDESVRRIPAFIKHDNRKLQVLQNQVLRMMTGLGPDTPTTTLHDGPNRGVRRN